MAAEFLYNNSVALILGLITLSGIGWWMYKLKKNNPDMKLGELLASWAVDETETIMMTVVLAMFLFSAILAATLQPPGENPPNVLARLGIHLVISFAGMACTLTAVRDAATVFKKDIDNIQRVFSIFIFILVTGISMGVPLLNLILIAAGLGEDLRVQLFLIDWLRSENTYQIALANAGLSKDFNSWNAMSYLLKAEAVATIIHYLLTILEAFRNIADPARRKMLLDRKSGFGIKSEDKEKDKEKEEKKEKKSSDPVPMPAEERQINAAQDNIKFLLIRFKYEGDELTKQIKNAWERLDKMDDNFKFKLGARIATAVTKLKTYDKSSEKSSKEYADIMKSIRKLFEGKLSESDPDKRGLGISLKGSLGK